MWGRGARKLHAKDAVGWHPARSKLSLAPPRWWLGVCGLEQPSDSPWSSRPCGSSGGHLSPSEERNGVWVGV